MLIAAVFIISAVLFTILETSPRAQLVKTVKSYSLRELLVTTRNSTSATEFQHVRKNSSLLSKLSEATRKKQILLIVGHGRSGSTLLANIFNQSPRVFYIFEPLHGVQRMYGRNNVDYDNVALHTLMEIFLCRFNDTKLNQEVSRFYRFNSKALSSPPFCKYDAADTRWNASTCRPVEQKLLESVCKTKYDITVLKILMDRIPWGSIGALFEACVISGVECKVIHLIRDSRPVVFSSRRVSFFKELDRITKPSLREFVYKICHLTEQNLELVRNFNPSLRKRYRLIRYEDLSMEPLKFLYELYAFAGLEVSNSVVEWLRRATKPSVTDLKKEERNAVSSVRNSSEILNRWRLNADPCEVHLIERYCRPVMNLMGYLPTDESVELLKNLDIPLFNNSYKAHEWLSL